MFDQLGKFGAERLGLKAFGVWGLILLLSLFGCREQPNPDLNFYYFKTSFSLDTEERGYLNSFKTQKIYLRVFDVDYNSLTTSFEIVSPLIFDELPDDSMQVVPVVFITNSTFKLMPDTAGRQLYSTVQEKLNWYIERLSRAGVAVDEIQFDCDWTAATQASYFQLLKEFKAGSSNHRITSTVRLHQLRVGEKIEAPPVESGVLMCYNTGNIRDTAEVNSILNLEVASHYLAGLQKYPIPLKVALPLFSWGVQYRHGEIVGLLRGSSQVDLERDTLLRKVGENKYEVLQSHYRAGRYIYQHDVIRFEKVELKQLEKLRDMLKKENRFPVKEVIFYHLDGALLKNYSTQELKQMALEIN